MQQTYDLQTSKHERGEKGCSPLQWRKPAYGEPSWGGGDICVGVLAQAESGPKFSQVMRANSTEVGSSWLTQTLFFQVHENEQFSYLWQRNKQNHKELCTGTWNRQQCLLWIREHFTWVQFILWKLLGGRDAVYWAG